MTWQQIIAAYTPPILNPKNAPLSDAFRKGGGGKQYPERIGEFATYSGGNFERGKKRRH
jgi:hypothetical protein